MSTATPRPSDQTHQTDLEIILKSNHEPEIFGAIFERHAATLHRFLSRRVERAAVDDLLSEVFATAFCSRASFKSTFSDARPWLFGIATNVIRHHQRSHSRRLRLFQRAKRHAMLTRQDDVEAVDRISEQSDGEATFVAVERAISQLDDRYRDVLLLAIGPELSYAEISEALGIPIGTVRSRMSRCRLQLRELLGESGQYNDEPLSVKPARD
jgi:RNA polymerase sigma-70 factor (ECF subfamily)